MKNINQFPLHSKFSVGEEQRGGDGGEGEGGREGKREREMQITTCAGDVS